MGSKSRHKFSICRVLIGTLICALQALVVLPYVAGFVSYATTFSGGITEQMWLDDVTDHLRDLRSDCGDPELREVLNYTIRRYNQIGPFDVAISRCDWYDWHPLHQQSRTLGMNNPCVSGITIDVDVISRYSIHSGEMILVHEALHDYPPYLGHKHITPVIDKLENRYVHPQ